MGGGLGSKPFPQTIQGGCRALTVPHNFADPMRRLTPKKLNLLGCRRIDLHERRRRSFGGFLKQRNDFEQLCAHDRKGRRCLHPAKRPRPVDRRLDMGDALIERVPHLTGADQPTERPPKPGGERRRMVSDRLRRADHRVERLSDPGLDRFKPALRSLLR